MISMLKKDPSEAVCWIHETTKFLMNSITLYYDNNNDNNEDSKTEKQ